MADTPLQERVHVIIPASVVSEMIVKAIADLTEERQIKYGQKEPPRLHHMVKATVEAALAEHIAAQLKGDEAAQATLRHAAGLAIQKAVNEVSPDMLAQAFVKAAAGHWRINQ